MSDFDAEGGRVEGWLQPLPDETAPCGPDLEYDNDFLALSLAAAGKPETQFGPAEPPDWRGAFDLASALLDRSRDLRIAIVWVRAGLHTRGFGFLPIGLRLLAGLIESLWPHVHPLPDPEDNDPYARVNALTLLAEPDVLISDLRSVQVVNDRAIGELTLRAIEVALGLLPARSGEAEIGRDQVLRMVEAAIDKTPELRQIAQQSAALIRRMVALVNERLGAGLAPDLKLLDKTVNAVILVLPPEAGPEEGSASGADAQGGARRGLSGAVNSREEAVRAIDLICEYLERSEPTNPAPLFLRRARHLIGHNFLQLMKELAPDALAEVARIVGVDPESVETPGGT